VCVLDRGGPLEEALRGAGVRVETLGWRRPLDLNPVRRLRHHLATWQPDVVHAWQPAALRALFLAGGPGTARLLVSAFEPGPARPFFGRLDRWLFRHADRAVAAHAAEAEHYRGLGVPEGAIVRVPPGVLPVVRPALSQAELCRQLGLPLTARFLACAGPLTAHKGHRDAIWAFDILKYLFEDLHLLIFGDGPRRGPLQEFVRAVHLERHVHFLGAQADVPGLLALAEVVWVPSLRPGGANVVLEGQAAGRPVVATRLRGLGELVAEGETGFLVAPGDKIELCRRTRPLLEDTALARRLGEAARRHVQARF
jgi:glycosyltransferase involved in cell wall biosynthesis